MKKKKAKSKSKCDLELIKPLPSIKNIKSEVIELENYPVFCFKYLDDTSFKKCKQTSFFVDFLLRLKKLSELGWDEIGKSDRHSFGMEKIPVNKIKPQLPTIITPEVKHLHVLRATGNNHPFIGLQVQKVFRVFYIESQFNDIYDH